jgi:hypothetical protein
MIRELINEVVYRTFKSYLKEAKMDFDYLYIADNGSDITEYVLNYLSWSEMGKMNADYSIMASKLHQALMYTLSLSHESQQDRRTFSNILRYLRILKKRVGIRSIKLYSDCGSGWQVSIEKTYDMESWTLDDQVFINGYDFEDYNNIAYIWDKAIVYKSDGGYETGGTDYRPGSDNGSSGYYTTSAKMTDEMKQKIYSMGLVPALQVSGSYHENFIDSVGVLPEMVSALKKNKNSGIYFECEFVD